MTTTSSPIACVRLPELPIVAHHTGTAAAVTTARSVHRGRGTRAELLYCDVRALEAGLRPGQSLAAARSRLSDLASQSFDARRLAEGRHRIVERLLHVTPRVSAAGPDRFWVEPVFAGRASDPWSCRAFQAFTRDLRRMTTGCGPVAVGIGPTATVAWAAAWSIGRLRDGERLVPPAEARTFLDESPLEVLEVSREAIDILASLGIRRVRELRALDPVSLGMRFGPAVAEARRRAEGADPRGPLTPPHVAPDEVSIELDDEVGGTEPLLFLLQPAAERLTTTLRRRDRGVVHARLELTVATRPQPTTPVLDVRTASPLTRGRPLLELLRTRLERERLDAPVTALRLRAVATVPVGERTEPLFRHAPRRDAGAQEVALDRLRTRLGETAVRRASRAETGAVLERARWLFDRETGTGDRGQAMPWRRIDPPAPIRKGRVHVAGRWRHVCKVGRVERVGSPWWTDGAHHVDLVAWAELEGPLLVLVHARCGTDCDDRWEVLAWVD